MRDKARKSECADHLWRLRLSLHLVIQREKAKVMAARCVLEKLANKRGVMTHKTYWDWESKLSFAPQYSPSPARTISTLCKLIHKMAHTKSMIASAVLVPILPYHRRKSSKAVSFSLLIGEKRMNLTMKQHRRGHSRHDSSRARTLISPR